MRTTTAMEIEILRAVKTFLATKYGTMGMMPPREDGAAMAPAEIQALDGSGFSIFSLKVIMNLTGQLRESSKNQASYLYPQIEVLDEVVGKRHQRRAGDVEVVKDFVD